MNKHRNDERREKFVSLLASGLSTAKAAAAVGISASTGFKWAQSVRRPQKRNAKAVRFAQLIPQSAVVSQMQIEVAGVSIKLDGNFDDHTLARLIRVARGAQ